jgi:hypothetical protein
MRRHLTYANVVSTLCLFVLLGGSAYAANKVGSKQIADNSVQGKDIKNGSITGKDVKRRSLTAGLFKAGQLPRGATGATGATGPQGPAGAPTTTLFASVNNAGQLNFGSHVVSTSGAGGSYTVKFDRSLNGCVPVVQPGFGSPSSGSNNSSNSLYAGSASQNTNTVTVTIGGANANGALTAGSFYVVVFC